MHKPDSWWIWILEYLFINLKNSCDIWDNIWKNVANLGLRALTFSGRPAKSCLDRLTSKTPRFYVLQSFSWTILYIILYILYILLGQGPIHTYSLQFVFLVISPHEIWGDIKRRGFGWQNSFIILVFRLFVRGYINTHCMISGHFISYTC